MRHLSVISWSAVIQFWFPVGMTVWMGYVGAAYAALLFIVAACLGSRCLLLEARVKRLRDEFLGSGVDLNNIVDGPTYNAVWKRR